MSPFDQLKRYNSVLFAVLDAIKRSLQTSPEDPRQAAIQKELSDKLGEIQTQLVEMDQEIVEMSANVLELAAGSQPPSTENQS